MTSRLHTAVTDEPLLATASVSARHLRDALGPLVLRERLQRTSLGATDLGIGRPAPAIRIIYQPSYGVTLESPDGRVRTPLPGVPVDASGSVSVEVDAKELQAAVADLSVGLDADDSVFALASSRWSTFIETSGARPIGRVTVLNAIVMAHRTENAFLPLLAAVALRAAGLSHIDPQDALADPSLIAIVDAMRGSLPNREYEIWTDEVPAWVRAGGTVLQAYDAAARATFLTAAEQAIVASLSDPLRLPLLERDACHTMVLLAACHDGRSRVPAPVLSAVPAAVVASVVARQSHTASGVANVTLIPSEQQRYHILTSHAGIGAAAPSPSAAQRLLGHAAARDETTPDAETRRYIELVANGEVREFDTSFALRLTAIPAHVLRGVLHAHGCLSDDALQSLSLDDRARAEIVAAAWPTHTLTPQALEQIGAAAGRTTVRLESQLQQQARHKRQDAQRRDRRLTVAHLVPSDLSAGPTHRVGLRSSLCGSPQRSTRVADVDVDTSPDAQGVRRVLHMPPAAFGLAAVDAGVPILCNLQTDTAVLVAPGPRRPAGRQQMAILAAWSARVATPDSLAVLQDVLAAPATDVIALWGDEVIAARAAAVNGRVAPANPSEGVTLPVIVSPSGVRINAGESTITLGPERGQVLTTVRERISSMIQPANLTMADNDRRFGVAEHALQDVTAALATAAARQGIGRTEHHGDGPGLHPADARISIAASVGTGFLSVHDGIRESVITKPAFDAVAPPTRVSMAPTVVADALDLAIASSTVQETKRTTSKRTTGQSPTQLRFGNGGDRLTVERGRTTAMALAIPADHHDGLVMDEGGETEEPTSITMVSLRVAM